jgi:sugar (pentulose or hexulose) kinase
MIAVVGIDKGTTMTKAVVFDAEDGRVLGLARRPTRSFRPRPDWHEEDMDGTWRGVAEAIREAIERSGVTPRDIAGVGVSGHMTGLWALDKSGVALGRSIAWPDGRAAGLLSRWDEDGRLAEMFKIWGNALMPGVTPILLAWMKENEPGFFDRAGHVFCAKDFVNYRLTGRIATDESDLSYFPVDIRARTLSPALFEMMGIGDSRRLVPEVLPVGAQIGKVTAAAAAETGLLAGTPVATGAGDAVAAAIGVGALEPGQAVTVIGTSFMNCLTVDRPILAPEGVGFLFMMPNGRWQKLMANTGGGSLCLDWVIDTFGQSVFEGLDADALFARIESEARALPPIPNGLLLHPYLNTSGMSAPRHIPSARGSVVGLGMETSPLSLVRAVMEGVALSMVDCYRALDADVREIRITGGGARSALWRDICAAAMMRPLLIPEAEETGALGVAMLAAHLVGIHEDLLSAAAKMARISDTIEPDPVLGARYAQAFPLFAEIGEALIPLWRERAAILARTQERSSP